VVRAPDAEEAPLTADTPCPSATECDAEMLPVIETRFIRLAERDRYEADGWEVTPMASFHAQWSHIATRAVKHG
jgi:hypothetical protein